MAAPARLATSSARQIPDAQQADATGAHSGRRSGRRIPPPREQRSQPATRPSLLSSASTLSRSTSARATTDAAASASLPHTPDWPDLPFLGDCDIPLSSDWGSDSLEEASLGMPSPSLEDITDDGQFLSAFADAEFSSPSSYPLFLNPTSVDDPQPGQAPTQAAQPGRAATASSPPRPAGPGLRAAPSRSATHRTASSVGVSQDTLFTNDLDDGAITPQTTQTSFADMPVPRSQRSPNASKPAGPPRKRARASGPDGDSSVLVLPTLDDDDLFGDKDDQPSDMAGLTTVDLTEANEVPETLRKPEADNRVKLSAFQCVICMDDVTTLTVTHCGHLFCQQCLHSSLNVDTTRGKCPMCRSKIDMKPRASYNTKTKGFWPLELKLMTRTRQGKRKADSMA